MPRCCATGLACSASLIAGFGEPDGEGPDRPRTDRLHERDDRRRIDAAGKECAERHVRDHLPFDRAAKVALNLHDGLFAASLKGLTAALLRDLSRAPVALDARLARPFGKHEEVAGPQLLESLIDV